MINSIRSITDSTLTAYATVLFSGSRLTGFFVLLSTLFNPYTALTGLPGILFSNVLAIFLGVNEERIKKGLYGFNGLLVGLSISLYHSVDYKLIFILFAAIVLLLFVTVSLEFILGHFLGLPVLSAPFTLVSMVTYFAFFNYTGFTLKENFIFPYDASFPALPKFLLYYFKSLGGIFFQSSPWSGLLITLILFFSSRIVFFLSVTGFALGIFFHTVLGGSEVDLSSGIVGFNYILTSIAVGGIFLIPNIHTFLLACLAVFASALIASSAKIFFVYFNIPVFSLPFVIVTFSVLYTARLLRGNRFIVVDFPPSSPEKNLDYYKTRLERFGAYGHYIRLPFSGKWKITQGYNGKFTHRDQWKESLDFMAVSPDGQIRKYESSAPEDFFTWSLPILSPGNGKVVKIVDHLIDNPVGELNAKDNWGNLVLIEHSVFLYSQVSHMQKNSILVKEGDYVTAGTRLGLAGNSGRSAEPHVHLHFQSTPEIGSPTVPVKFTQFLLVEKSETTVKFNSIPSEDSIVINLSSDFNLKSFFVLAPGQEYKIESVLPDGKTVQEKWKADIDFWGNRFIEDEDANRVYFFTGSDYFACLDYIGERGTSLFIFYLGSYRLPFISENSKWSDRISYKHFSNPFINLFKDFVQPFTDLVSMNWNAEIKTGKEGLILNSTVTKNDGSGIYSVELNLSKQIPGIIRATNSAGKEWAIRWKE